MSRHKEEPAHARGGKYYQGEEIYTSEESSGDRQAIGRQKTKPVTTVTKMINSRKTQKLCKTENGILYSLLSYEYLYNLIDISLEYQLNQKL